MDVWLSAGMLLLATTALGACTDTDVVLPPPAELQGRRVEPELEVRQRAIERLVDKEHPLQVAAFRTGGGLAVLLTRNPTAYWQTHYELPHRPSGGRFDPRAKVMGVALGMVSDVVGVTGTSALWFLDSATSRVNERDLGAFRRPVAMLGNAAGPNRACTSDDRHIAFVSPHRQGQVVLHFVGDTLQRRWPVPLSEQELSNTSWDEWQFSGVAQGVCALWNPRVNALVVVTIDSLHRVDLGPRSVRPKRPWYRRSPAASIVLRDVAVFPSGFAILRPWTSASGDIAQFYSSSGALLETVALARSPVLRIAGSSFGLLSIRMDRDSVLFARYPVPASMRAEQWDRDSAVFAPRLAGAIVLSDSAGVRNAPPPGRGAQSRTSKRP